MAELRFAAGSTQLERPGWGAESKLKTHELQTEMARKRDARASSSGRQLGVMVIVEPGLMVEQSGQDLFATLLGQLSPCPLSPGPPASSASIVSLSAHSKPTHLTT